jgi:hypothetical protein
MAYGKFEFSGTGISCLWLFIWTTVLSIITFGLCFPWTTSAFMRWITENTTINGKQLCFKGTGLGFFANWLLLLVLTIITFGIYMPWGICRINRWIINNTYFANEGDVEATGSFTGTVTHQTTIIEEIKQLREEKVHSNDIEKLKDDAIQADCGTKTDIESKSKIMVEQNQKLNLVKDAKKLLEEKKWLKAIDILSMAINEKIDESTAYYLRAVAYSKISGNYSGQFKLTMFSHLALD